MRAPRYRWGHALLGALSLACGGRAMLDDRTLDDGASASGGGGVAGQRPEQQPPQDFAGDCQPGYCAGAMQPSYGTGGSASGGSGGIAGIGFGDGGFGGSGSSFAGSVGTGSGGTGGASAGTASGGSAPSGGSAGAPPVKPPSFPLLPRALPGATAIVSDPVRSRLYVAVGPGAFDYANSIVTFEPNAGVVIADVPVGANPDSLAISDDGTTLWVGRHDASSVLEVDVSGDGLVPVVEYPLPPTDFPPYAQAAGPMVVLPGTTSSLAVSLHYDGVSPSLAGVVLLDDGVARPLRLPSHTGASRLTRGPEGYLFGFNNLHTGYGVYAISVSLDGLTQTEHSNLVAGFSTDIVYDSNLLFGTDGAVISVGSPEYPLPLGPLPVTGQVFPDVVAGVAWVLEGAESEADVRPVSLVLVNLPTREVLDRTSYGTPVLRPRHFVRSSDGVFAFIADMADSSGFGLGLESGVFWMRP